MHDYNKDRMEIPILLLKDVPEHYHAVGNMIFEQWPLDCDGCTSGEAYANHLRERDGIGVRRTWVALSNDAHNTVIGTVSLLDQDLPERSRWTPWVASLLVHPDHRRKGVGSRLLRHATEYALDMLGQSVVYLWTDRTNIAFYKAHRWQCIEVLRRRQVPRFKGSVIYVFKYPCILHTPKANGFCFLGFHF